MKQAADARLNRDYSNEKYQNLSENASFYDNFSKRLNQSQNRTVHARRGDGVTGEAFEFGNDGARRERTVDAYGSAHKAASGNLPGGRRSLGK